MHVVHHKMSGFSLIEAVLSIMIMGIMFAAILAFLKPLQQNEPLYATKERFARIEYALETYIQANGELPCPASLTSDPQSLAYGVATDCTVAPAAGVFTANDGRVTPEQTENIRIGAIPFRSLNLSAQYGVDGWGNRFIYAVTERLTQDDLFDNNHGGIKINDSASGNMLSTEGTALYAVISTGNDGKGAYNAQGGLKGGGCSGSGIDLENCDMDATFVTTERSSGTVYYDDLISYKTFIGDLEPAACGNLGMIFAPAHPESDGNGCLNPGYVRQSIITLNGDFSVGCGTSSVFCNGSTIDIGDFTPGDYLIHWSAYLKFDYPQPSQYAVLEFEADDIIQSSEKIPFLGNICDDPASAPLQNESGLLRFNIDNDTTMTVRLRFYGGANDPDANGCSGQTPTLNLVEVGEGSTDATKTLSVDPYRKPQTF